MAKLNQALLHPWLDSLEVHFWDPEVHVFKFGIQELCLTVEEFHAYLESHDSDHPIAPMIWESMKKLLKTKLGVSSGATDFLIQDGAIKILRRFEMFNPPKDLTDFKYQGHRITACCICLLTAFLLVSSFGEPISLLVGVAAQIEAHKNVAPLVLAKTLMGLNVVHAGQTQTFGDVALRPAEFDDASS
ncbi:hypothetical protein RHMOL_Rhmol11G0065800 [Rhododendron molle]|uniref:Uncharacterized protein n=1 Tax=Rhododendron molle TaxID=49168 RepID=A0ACC0LPQ3_RHOML|nr:hypothetical protein RHMOL_Rhmol11G0065800 [Rhododendron molle]